jgi:hypothetical protein
VKVDCKKIRTVPNAINVVEDRDGSIGALKEVALIRINLG